MAALGSATKVSARYRRAQEVGFALGIAALYAASASDGRCRISVIDHGHGIPAGFRKELFERFSQADTSDGRSRGGTGLGMAIAKHLTEQMSGRISFESEENVGTVFHLEFPLASSETDSA